MVCAGEGRASVIHPVLMLPMRDAEDFRADNVWRINYLGGKDYLDRGSFLLKK